MKKNLFISILLSAVLFISWASCQKVATTQVALPGNEILTTMVIKAININDATDTPSAKWVQLDPTGAKLPDTSHSTLVLRDSASYNVTIQFLDTLSDITSGIKVKENYHIICFDASNSNLIVKRMDHDTNPKQYEVGLVDLFTTTGISAGKLEITLHHQPNVKDGTCTPGSIDMDATFNVNIILH